MMEDIDRQNIANLTELQQESVTTTGTGSETGEETQNERRPHDDIPSGF